MKQRRVVLITGETRGFGFEMAKLFINNNDIVCGFSRNEFNYLNIYHQVGDISKEEDCKRCVLNIIDKYKRIDVLINNAGFGIFGPVEETTIQQAKKQIDVTFLGSFLMAKEVLPFMRKQKNGRIINISSIGGVVPLPYQAFYSASKCAMDILFDALRAEVYPYHIQITSVKPGDSCTSFTQNRESKISGDSVYKESFERNLKNVSNDEQKGFKPIKVAKKVLNISKKRKAPYSVKVGNKDKFLSVLFKILPKRIRNYLLYKIYAK